MVVVVVEPRQLVGAALCTLIGSWSPLLAPWHALSATAAARAARPPGSVVLLGHGLGAAERAEGLLRLFGECPQARFLVLGPAIQGLQGNPRVTFLARGQDATPEMVRQELLRLLGAAASAAAEPDHRDRLLLDLIRAGRTNREIGNALCLAESTIKWRIQKLCRRHGARNRVELLRVAEEESSASAADARGPEGGLDRPPRAGRPSPADQDVSRASRARESPNTPSGSLK